MRELRSLETLAQIRLETSSLRKEVDSLDRGIRDCNSEKDRASIELVHVAAGFCAALS